MNGIEKIGAILQKFMLALVAWQGPRPHGMQKASNSQNIMKKSTWSVPRSVFTQPGWIAVHKIPSSLYPIDCILVNMFRAA